MIRNTKHVYSLHKQCISCIPWYTKYTKAPVDNFTGSLWITIYSWHYSPNVRQNMTKNVDNFRQQPVDNYYAVMYTNFEQLNCIQYIHMFIHCYIIVNKMSQFTQKCNKFVIYCLLLSHYYLDFSIYHLDFTISTTQGPAMRP